MTALGARMLAEARRLTGVPWAHMGRTEHGLDCVGLPLLCAWRCGVDVPDVVGYGRLPDGFSLARSLRERLRQVYPVDGEWQFEDGDVLMTGRRVSMHVGMMGTLPDGSPSIVHCAVHDCVRESRFSPEAFPVRGLFRPTE